MDANKKIELELPVDTFGPGSVLTALAEICFEKAQHVRESYSDEPLAKEWERNAQKISRIIFT